MDSIHLFVYGTLLKEADNQTSKFLASHAVFTGKGFFYGKLYKVSWYPGAVLGYNVSEKVYGVVFKITNHKFVFNVLDEYEGVGKHHQKPHLFKKEIISVFLENNTEIKAYAYLYNRSTEGLKQIMTGDFLKSHDGD